MVYLFISSVSKTRRANGTVMRLFSASAARSNAATRRLASEKDRSMRASKKVSTYGSTRNWRSANCLIINAPINPSLGEPMPTAGQERSRDRKSFNLISHRAGAEPATINKWPLRSASTLYRWSNASSSKGNSRGSITANFESPSRSGNKSGNDPSSTNKAVHR